MSVLVNLCLLEQGIVEVVWKLTSEDYRVEDIDAADPGKMDRHIQGNYEPTHAESFHFYV